LPKNLYLLIYKPAFLNLVDGGTYLMVSVSTAHNIVIELISF